MARNNRFKRLAGGSKREKEMLLLLEELYPTYEIYCQYPYDLILEKGYKISKTMSSEKHKALLMRSRKLHADFCILKLMMVIEVQGEHHYTEINYSGDMDEATARLETRKHLDMLKRLICLEAGFTLVEFPYFKRINKDVFNEVLNESSNNLNKIKE